MALTNRPIQRNDYEFRDNHVVIFLDRLNGSRLECLIDAEDLSRVLGNGRKWHAAWSEEAKTFYANQRTGPSMHRLIMDTPDDLEVDHGDHNGLNNRKVNLTNCDGIANCANRRPRNKAKRTSSSPYKGVYLYAKTGRFRAQVYFNGGTLRRDLPGSFETAEQTANALAAFQVRVSQLIDSFVPPGNTTLQETAA